MGDEPSRPHDAIDTILQNNDRAATRISGGYNGISETGVGNENNTAEKLTTSDVGPDS